MNDNQLDAMKVLKANLPTIRLMTRLMDEASFVLASDFVVLMNAHVGLTSDELVRRFINWCNGNQA
jgi:hypothetical protein